MTEDIQLTEPFKNLEGVQTAFVSMRTKVRVGDWRAVNKQAKDSEERTFLMVCRLCALDIKECEQLCMADFGKLAGKIDMGDEQDPKE